MHPVRACDQNRIGLPAAVDVVVILPVFKLNVAGVIQIHLPAFDEGTSGIYTAAVKRLIRIERYSLIFPFDHILTCIMSPHLDSALCVKG